MHIYTKFAKANVKLKERPLHEAIHISVIKKLHYYDLTSETPYQKIRGLHKTTCSFTRTIVGDAAKRHQNTSDTSELTPNIT